MSVTKHYICLLSLRFVTIFNDLKIKIFLQIKSWHLAVRWPKNNLKILIKIIKPFTSTSDATVDVWFLCQTYPVPYIPYHLSQTRLLCGESNKMLVQCRFPLLYRAHTFPLTRNTAGMTVYIHMYYVTC